MTSNVSAECFADLLILDLIDLCYTTAHIVPYCTYMVLGCYFLRNFSVKANVW